MAASVNSMPTRIFNSTLIYDVILVVVLGGIGLSGGRGGVLNVIIGTLLIGTMLNGMTIMDVSYSGQNLVKGVVLLVAIIRFVPQSAQRGDRAAGRHLGQIGSDHARTTELTHQSINGRYDMTLSGTTTLKTMLLGLGLIAAAASPALAQKGLDEPFQRRVQARRSPARPWPTCRSR